MKNFIFDCCEQPIRDRMPLDAVFVFYIDFVGFFWLDHQSENELTKKIYFHFFINFREKNTQRLSHLQSKFLTEKSIFLEDENKAIRLYESVWYSSFTLLSHIAV